MNKNTFYNKNENGTIRQKVSYMMEDVPALSKLSGKDWYEVEDAICELIRSNEEFLIDLHNEEQERRRRAYYVYRIQWCEARDYDFNEVRKAYYRDEQYNGEMYVCYDEFIDNEYQDDEYVEELLKEYDKMYEEKEVK